MEETEGNEPDSYSMSTAYQRATRVHIIDDDAEVAIQQSW